ncbi:MULTISPECIES: DUF1364 domain-containing protein [Pseudomonas]|uniref:DUF1364 domain-containing protein n=1 Tax=Pseudomonas TaxID=286 RepID=UPI0006D3FE36|nr:MULTISPECIES: DUF1364 domain-containing protein [unclassified Pseudomonas]
MRQSKLTKAARGRECQVRIPGICNGNPETTVLAHYRMAGTCGVGSKPHDLQGAWACSTCHDACDGRIKAVGRETARHYHAEGVMRTQAILLAEAVVIA